MPYINSYVKKYSDKLFVEYTPVLQVRNSSTFIYWKPDSLPKMSEAAKYMMSQRMKKNKTYSGTVTFNTRKRIRIAVNLLLQASPTKKILNPVNNRLQNFKVNFITLTIPVQSKRIDASEGYTKCLKPFLQWLQKTRGVKHYIWKAELQSETDFKGNKKRNKGQLHYHITSNVWIHYQDIRNKWNYLLAKAHYMHEYSETYHGINPNTTDVHKVYKIKDIEAYLVKYISKEQKNKDSLNGKIWDCSKTLKGKKYFTTEWIQANEDRLQHYIKTNTATEIDSEHGIFLKLQKDWFEYILSNKQLHQYKEFIKTVQ